MADGFAAGGRIDIKIMVGDGRIAGVSIENRRHFNHGRLLRGLTADEAVRRISQLFSVCRFGQGVAAALAFEHSSGMTGHPAQADARRMLVLAETLLDHASRILLEWPALHGVPPVVPPLKAVRSSLLDLWMFLYPDGDWNRPGGGRLRPLAAEIKARLAAAGTALAGAGLLCPESLDAWDEGLATGQGPAAGFFGAMIGDGTAGIAAAPFPFLTDEDEAGIAAALAGQGAAFAAKPGLDGTARETGPYARLCAHPLIVALRTRHGDGLLVRFAAQFLEMALCLAEMRDLAGHLREDNGSQLGYDGDVGVGMVQAVRGGLVHRAVVEDGRVADYQIVAPTEWNFHPRGPLVLGLNGKPCGEGAEMLARLFAAALDPCVETKLMVERHA